eukprot:1954635-Amphidinium_carterae.1
MDSKNREPNERSNASEPKPCAYCLLVLLTDRLPKRTVGTTAELSHRRTLASAARCPCFIVLLLAWKVGQAGTRENHGEATYWKSTSKTRVYTIVALSDNY